MKDNNNIETQKKKINKTSVFCFNIKAKHNTTKKTLPIIMLFSPSFFFVVSRKGYDEEIFLLPTTSFTFRKEREKFSNNVFWSMLLYVYLYFSLYVCFYGWLSVCLYCYVFFCLYVSLYVCLYGCLYVCMSVCMSVRMSFLDRL